MVNQNHLVNHKYRMRIKDLQEAPIGNIDTVDMTDNGSFSHRTDRAIIGSEKARMKIRRVLARVPQTIDLVFMDTGTEVNLDNLNTHVMAIGGVFDHGDLRNRVQEFPQPSQPDSIMLVLTNNEGRNRVQISPWILMHRMGHGIAINDDYEAHLHNINHCLNDVTQFVRDGWGSSSLPVIYAIGTMKSAREQSLTVGLEIIFEWVAQYCVQGQVRLNRMTVETMQALCPPHPDYRSAKPVTEQDVAEFNAVIRFAEHNINSTMERLMRALEGKVVII
jgi:hypothetical protein